MPSIDALGLIEKFVFSGVRQGLSGAEVLRGLRAGDLGIRTADFYRLYNGVTAGVRAAENIKYANKSTSPTASTFYIPPYEMRHAFKYDVKVYAGPGTQGDDEFFIWQTVTSDDPLTISEIEQAALENVGQRLLQSDVVATRGVVTFAYARSQDDLTANGL